MRAMRLLLLALVIHLIAPEPAHAYIDPSAGSIVLQLVAGVVLGGLLTMKGWWGRLGQRVRLVWAKILRP